MPEAVSSIIYPPLRPINSFPEIDQSPKTEGGYAALFQVLFFGPKLKKGFLSKEEVERIIIEILDDDYQNGRRTRKSVDRIKNSSIKEKREFLKRRREFEERGGDYSDLISSKGN